MPVSPRTRIEQTHFNQKHGASKGGGTAEYRVWRSMRSRCNNPRDSGWSRYGGRGIRVCERWNSFENFLADMGPRPSLEYSIDRIDNNGNYEPSNCRWATDYEQNRNRSDNIFMTCNGKTQCMSDWAKELGLCLQMVFGRWERSWSDLDCLLIPPNTTKVKMVVYNGKSQSVAGWCRELGLSKQLVYTRLRRNWSVEKAFSRGVV